MDEPKTEATDQPDEDVSKETTEPGRIETEQDAAGRPTGTSTARDYTGVSPKEPQDGGSPAG